VGWGSPRAEQKNVATPTKFYFLTNVKKKGKISSGLKMFIQSYLPLELLDLPVVLLSQGDLISSEKKKKVFDKSLRS
jgi:hypothetical protein